MADILQNNWTIIFKTCYDHIGQRIKSNSFGIKETKEPDVGFFIIFVDQVYVFKHIMKKWNIPVYLSMVIIY